MLRCWEDQGGWWEALVGDYSVKNSKHQLIYDAGREEVRTPAARHTHCWKHSSKNVLADPLPPCASCSICVLLVSGH